LKYSYKRKFILILILILITFRSFKLPSYSYPKLISKASSQSTLFIEYGSNDVSALIQRVHFDINYEASSDAKDIISIFLPWVLITTLLKLGILLLDRRKLIMALMTSYFEGSKYKYSILHL
jgi:surface polysaccharide O-acyltransferase-like enzyme